MAGAKLPNSAQESQPWRIHELVPDFVLEDVWALPVEGGRADFPALIKLGASFDPANSRSKPTRFLWRLRDRLGRWLDLGEISSPVDASAGDDPGALPIPGTDEASLRARLPADLRDTTADLDFGSLPFVPLYRTENEFAAEVSNKTVHGAMHIAWVDRGNGRYRGQMAVYVKPRGRFGQAYMAAIKPFRYRIVYPALMGEIESAWKARGLQQGAP